MAFNKPRLAAPIGFPKSRIAAGICIAVLLIVMQASPVMAKKAAKDDQFGMSFDSSGGRTGYIPANTQGIEISYSVSTSGVTCGSSSGWVWALDSLKTNGGGGSEWFLQAGPALSCDSYPSSAQWEISTEVQNPNGQVVGTCPPTCQGSSALAILSTSTYPTLSGTIDIHYTGSAWAFNIYVSQTGSTYSPSSYSSIQGTYVDGTNNDWDNVETNPQQSGISFASGFQWTANVPEFYVSGVWQTWNHIGGGYYWLYAYADYSASITNNHLVAQQVSSQGVQVVYNSSPTNNDNTLLTWRLNPCCAPPP
jgi:hypothetical protein